MMTKLPSLLWLAPCFALGLAFNLAVAPAAFADDAAHEVTHEASAPAAGAESTAVKPEAAGHGEAAAPGAAHEGEGHGHAAGIPMSVTYQLINFLIYIGLLVYFLRKPIKNFFRNREQIYKQALVKGETARRDAENKKREVQHRLTQLETSSNASLQGARAEANALKQQIQQEGEALAKRLREEATRSADVEIQRAKTQLREEMLTQSVALARQLLEDKIAEPDQKRLQSEFVGKIDEVR